MIPKIIHYVWLGKGPKSAPILQCIETWKHILPDYDIREWNEDNFGIDSHAYIKKAYEEKRWAFASDLVRLIVLEKYGGIYLDTDMYVLKKFDNFLEYDLVLGKEDNVHISAGMIAAPAGNLFIQKVIERYDRLNEYVTIPRVLSEVYVDFNNKKYEEKVRVKVFDPLYFYPFTAGTIKNFTFNNAPPESYAVHMWDYSWGNKYVKFLKKIGIHRGLVSLSDSFGVKKIVKKILKIV